MKKFYRIVHNLVILLSLGLTHITLGQEHEHEHESEEFDTIKEVIVTGSAIKHTHTDMPYAVTSFDRDALADQGSPLFADLLKNLGAALGTLGERQGWYNYAQANTVPENVTAINLRGLGASRTLVLLNGKRQVYIPAQLFGGRFVDVNSFPSIALDNIEILKEGASAVYGSDAVAGVVNFITRDDFKGTELSVNVNEFAGAGDATLGGIWGGEFDQIDIVVSFEHSKRRELGVRERDWLLRPYTGDGGWSFWGNPGAVIVPDEPPPADAVEFIQTLQETPHFIDPECQAFGGHVENFPDYPEFNSCRFRYAPWDNIVEDMVHNRVFAELNGALANDTQWHLEFLWSQSDIPNWLTTPSFPPRSQFDGLQLIATDHPGRIAFCERYGDVISECSNTNDWYFYGRLVGNAGPGRLFERSSQTWRLAGSLDGNFLVGDRELSYDVGVSYSNAVGHMETAAEYGYREFLAYRGFGGPNCGVGVVADYSEPSSLALGAIPNGVHPGRGDCHYYNPLSVALEYSRQVDAKYQAQPNPNYVPSVSNNRAMLDWIFETVKQDSDAALLVIDSVVGGAWMEERIHYAFGYQFRNFSVSSETKDPSNLALNPCPVPGDKSCGATSGLFTFTVGTFPYSDDQSMHRLFGEMEFTLRDHLQVQVAANFESHDEANSFDPKISLRYELMGDLAFRASFQTTFRTPSVDDLNEQQFTSLEYIAEADIYKAVNTFGYKGLDPESAFTYNIGLVWESNYGEFSVDYWSYQFEDLIGPVPHAGITKLYADETTRANVEEFITCPGGVHPCNPIAIERVRVDLTNWPGVDTSGIDFLFTRHMSLAKGDLSVAFSGTYVHEYLTKALIRFGFEFQPSSESAGYLNQPNPMAPPIPKLKLRTSLAYRWYDYGVVSYLNYISSYKDRTEADSQYYEIDDQVTLDTTFHWNLADRGLNLSFSIINLFDATPPEVNWEMSYDGFTHDPKGRQLKLAAAYRFL